MIEEGELKATKIN